MGLPEPSLMASFLAGLLSFVSPCVLPLVPSYITYITGLSLDQLTDTTERHRIRKTVVANALLFIGGFSTVFVALGASASLVGQLLSDYQDLVRKIGGVLIAGFGLYLLGALKINSLRTERRFHFRRRPAGFLGSFLIGAAFAAGWTPCVGPVLGSVLMYAGTTERLLDGVTLLAYYSLGLGLPLFATALGVDRFLAGFRQVRAYLGAVSVLSGAFLIAFGLVVYTNALPYLTAFFEQYGIGSYLE